MENVLLFLHAGSVVGFTEPVSFCLQEILSSWRVRSTMSGEMVDAPAPLIEEYFL